MRGKSNEAKGQGIVEYILITALVALAAVGIFKAFRADLDTAYRKAGEALIQGVEGGVSSDSSSQ
jgi:Flp pilus assembly pilin Flp